MKRISLYITLLVLVIIIPRAGAQDKRHNSQMHEEIQSLKIAYMTETLALTPAESEKFWPIYNKYWNDRVKLTVQRRAILKKIENDDAGMEDLEQMIQIGESEVHLMKRYIQEMSEAVSVQKAAKTFIAEERFKGTLIRRAQDGNRPSGSNR